MQYMGSKRSIAKYIIPIMLEGYKGNTWVEPFVGGCNCIDKVQGLKRIGADKSRYLIAFWNKILGGGGHHLQILQGLKQSM